MRCDDFLPLIEKLVDGEAAAAERQQAEAHLESCTSCQSHFRFLKALPEAARQASLPDPPDMYWEVLPRKIMSRIEKEGATRRRGWFSQMLAPSRLRWGGALAAALVAAVLGLRVLQLPLAYRDAPAPGKEVMEEESPALSADSLTPARRQASEEPVEDAAREEPTEPKEPRQFVALDDDFEQAARKRVAGEPAPPAAPEIAREEFAADALSSAGKAGQEKQDDAGEAAARRVIGGRLEQDFYELKSTQPDEKNRDQGRARSAMPAETANVPQAEARGSQGQKPAAAVPPADREQAAQSVSVSRTLRAQPALEEAPSSAAQGYRDLVARYPLRDEPTSSASLSGVAKEKEGAFSDAELETECDEWRQFLARYPGDEREADARYRLALCSIALFDRSPSEDNRRPALDDGTSYLEVATDEERAEAIRRALARIRP